MEFTSTSQTGVTAQPTQPIQRVDPVSQQAEKITQEVPPVAPVAPQISQQAQDILNAERNMGKKFDVQNMSTEDFLQLRDELREEGLISPLQSEELTALFNQNQESLQAIKGEGERPHNVLNMLQEQVEGDGGSKPRFADLFNLFSSLDS